MNYRYENYNFYNVCEVCGGVATIIGCEDYTNEYNKTSSVPVHIFCQEHFDNWRNNEIELPQSRLDILNYD